MAKWLDFGSKILKRRDIDFIEWKYDENTIECHHHQGQSYMITKEQYETDKESLERYCELRNLLGVNDGK